MKGLHRIKWTIFFLILFGFLSFSTASCNQIKPNDGVERTRPPDSPWKYTPTENFGLTATSQYLMTQTQQAVIAEATAQVEATVTAEAFAMLSTATASARDSAIISYQYYEPFDQNTFDWRVEGESDQYWKFGISIQNGNYIWRVDSAKEAFIAWSDFTKEKDLKDFDVALKARRREGEPQAYCYGLLFRRSPDGFEAGSYVLSVCENGYFRALYFDVENNWDTIQDWTRSEAINSDDWNLIEIIARGEDFAIFINHQPVSTFSDPRLASGLISILIEVLGETPGQIEVDFFALQPQ